MDFAENEREVNEGLDVYNKSRNHNFNRNFFRGMDILGRQISLDEVYGDVFSFYIFI
mgnify:CR=1 FL=1